MQYSVTVRNARLDSVEASIGTSPILKIRSGAVPANCAAADTGTVLATVALPSDWMAPANNGVKTMLGTWEDTSADATGIAGHFRIYDTTGTTCHMQGSVTMNGSGGDMTVDNTSFAVGQDFIVTSFQITAGNS
jgi:hypothetical protein